MTEKEPHQESRPGKIVPDIDTLKAFRIELRRRKKKVAFTNGCFDILHAGHIHLFGEAKKHGDILIVAVNDDTSVRKIKGPSRPVFSLAERLEVLEAVVYIDYLISFSEETPRNLVRVLLPDIILKGGDWREEEVIGREEVRGVGGRVIIVSYLPGKSTSSILDLIARINGPRGAP